MALSNQPVFPQKPKLVVCQFLQGTDVAGTYKTVATGGGDGTIIRSMTAVCNDAASAHLVTLALVRAAVNYGGFSLNVPLSAGYTAAAPAVNIFSTWPGLPLDSDGNPYIILQSGDLLQATFATALAAASVLNLFGMGADYS